MLEILGITSPLFAAIGLGYLAVRLNFFSKTDIRVLGRFVIAVALPALLFKALSERSFSDILNVTYLTGYGLGSRSEEHTSELQSLMRISYAVFCLKKKKQTNTK